MTSSPSPGAGRTGPLGLLLGLFSSIWLGVTLMTVLFLYSWVGSAGLPIYTGGMPWRIDAWVFEQMRQWPGLEMTEFEWFNWWPFNLIIGLICANITITTLRRIKLNRINLGVWMIHAGILILCLGSWMYFSTKVEGDAPVVRRRVVAVVPGGGRVDFPAVPGASARAMGEAGMYSFFVSNVDPEWTLLSGPNSGETAYSVQVTVDGPGQRFIRQLIANEPDATQDSIFVEGNGGPPLQRAIKALGRPLVDEQLDMSLTYASQEWFYLANWVEKSWALYLREKGSGPWIQRPVEGLPLYNDFVRSLEEVWPPDGETLPPRPLDVTVPAFEAGDPLAGVPLHIRSYLRYAQMESKWVQGERLNPTASVRLEDGFGEFFDHELVAFDPGQNTVSQGFLNMAWVEDEAEREQVAAASPAILHLSIPGVDGELTHVIDNMSLADPELPFEDVPGSDYKFRVQFVQRLDEPGLPGAVASVELRQGDRAWRRFVSEDERFIRDVNAGDADNLTPTETYDEVDPGIVIHFHSATRPAAVTLVAGPGPDDLGVVLALGSPQDGQWLPVAVGEAFSLGGGDTFTVRRFSAHSVRESRPAVVPRRIRNRDARESNSMVRVQFDVGGELYDEWVGFHQYPIEAPGETLRRYWYQPTEVRVGGKVYEFILSRQRLPLPAPVVLDDFVIDSHVGGFTGRTSSILNWTSSVRFDDGAGAYTDPMLVSVNAPTEHQGLWYFQAQWDPPSQPMFRGDPGSKGLNYTVLGVGNRVGVEVQLWGCCIAVLGMLYAFYVKPILIKRRREGASTAKTPKEVSA